MLPQASIVRGRLNLHDRLNSGRQPHPSQVVIGEDDRYVLHPGQSLCAVSLNLTHRRLLSCQLALELSLRYLGRARRRQRWSFIPIEHGPRSESAAADSQFDDDDVQPDAPTQPCDLASHEGAVGTVEVATAFAPQPRYP